MFSEENIAWAAGILEGEGTFSLRTRKRRNGSEIGYAAIFCAMTDFDILHRLGIIFGGSIRGPFRAEKSTKDIWQWSMTRAERVEAVLLYLLPYMGMRRSSKIREQLLQLEAMKNRDSWLQPCGTRAKYERGCRCRPCIDARMVHNSRMKEQRLRRAGQAQFERIPLIDSALRQSERALPEGSIARPAVYLEPSGSSSAWLVIRI